MLTSGSTSMPKAVIQTQRMIASNIAQGRQVLGQTAGWNDVMLDWLPWNHVSGAFTKLGTMTSGGTLYIDGGRPMPGLFEESLQNLKEITPKFYVNVPFGYAMLADALEKDPELRERFFGSVRLALYGGAGLPQTLYDRFQRLAIETIGERIFFTTGYGATETSSGCMAIYFPTEEVGIGLPMPGITLKLVPNGPRYEVRLRGPMITPGYLANPEANRGIFDDEGFYRTGDTAQLHDPDDIQKGLKFAGRLAEDFKLATGTWVAAGRLRAELLEAFAPLLAEVLVCGENREYVALLGWPKTPEAATATADLSARLAGFNAARGSSERAERLVVVDRAAERGPPRSLRQGHDQSACCPDPQGRRRRAAVCAPARSRRHPSRAFNVLSDSPAPRHIHGYQRQRSDSHRRQPRYWRGIRARAAAVRRAESLRGQPRSEIRCAPREGISGSLRRDRARRDRRRAKSKPPRAPVAT